MLPRVSCLGSVAVALVACAHCPPPAATEASAGLGWVRTAFRIEVAEHAARGGAVLPGPSRDAHYTLSRSFDHAFVGRAEVTLTPHDEGAEPSTTSRELSIPEASIDALLDRIATLAEAAGPPGPRGTVLSEPRPTWSITVTDGGDSRLVLRLVVDGAYDAPLRWMLVDPHGLLQLDGVEMAQVVRELSALLTP